jgi:hypothetical protein
LRRARDAQALSDSEAGDAIVQPKTAASKKPRRYKAYFEVRFFRRDARGTSRTRLSAREEYAVTQTSTLKRHVNVRWRAQVDKKRANI